MNPQPDIKTPEPPRIIVLERRSLVSQVGGLWFVAVPLLMAYWISTMPRDLSEPAPATLNLPGTDWIKEPRPELVKQPDSKIELPAKPDKPVRPAPVVTKTIIAEKPSAKPAEPPQEKQELPKGVVVLDKPGMAANPVAVFDPTGNAAKAAEKQPSDDQKPEPAPPVADPAQETQLALAEIKAAAESAKNKKQRDETLMPLLAEHEKLQAEKRRAEQIAIMKHRAETGREPFFAGLQEILGGEGNVIAKGEKIDLFMRRESDGFNMNLYKPSFTIIETAKRSPSTARKIDFLRSEGVPEPVILAYLIQLDIRQLRKPEGPRDTNDAIVRSAKLLLRNRD